MIDDLNKYCLVAAFFLLTLIFNKNVYDQVFSENFFQYEITNDLTYPVGMALTPTSEMLIAERQGKVRIVKNDTLQPVPAITLQIQDSHERGLCGIALDPDFINNGYVYLFYTLPDGSRNKISRFTFEDRGINAASEFTVLELDSLSELPYHNGGSVAFDSEGVLIVGIGDQFDVESVNKLNRFNGKILRINTDGTIPDHNLYEQGSEHKRRIWAYGLRNLFTIAISEKTGKIFANEAGYRYWEEINNITQAGLYLGWPTYGEGPIGTADSLTHRLFTYPNNFSPADKSFDERGCAVTGGTFFEPLVTNYPEKYQNKYFFMDYCNRWIKYFDPADKFRKFLILLRESGA
jgi:glucose/arabinose dehydrogenase